MNDNPHDVWRKPMMGRRTFLAVTGGVTLVLAGCGSGGGDGTGDSGQKPVSGGKLTYAISNEIASLDPAKISSSSGAGSAPGYALFGALLTLDAKTGAVVPRIAESMKSDTTGKIWTLKLREGVKFSDGSPYDAEAVKFNFTRYADPKIGSQAASYATSITSMTAVSPTELRIELAAPNAIFDRAVAKLMFFIGSPTFMKAHPDQIDTKPVGAGPFILESWVRDSAKTFKRNPDYYEAPKPYVDELIIQTIPDTRQSVTALRAGQLDIALFWNTADASRAASANGSSSSVLSPGSPCLALNMTKAPFDDVRLRQAVRYAIDSDQAAEVLGSFAATAAPFPKGSPSNFGLSWPAADEAKAQKLFDDVAADNGGTVRFTISCFQEAGNQAEGKYLQSVLNQYDNVDVKVNVEAAATVLGNVFSKSYEANTWGTPWWTAADLEQYLKSDSIYNVFGFDDPEVDKAVTALRSSTDEAGQARAAKVLVSKMVEALPMVTYGSREVSNVHSSQVHGVEPFFDGLINFEGIWKAQ